MRNHRFLDVHHLDPRCEGGGHEPDRLATLCGAHHRAVHAGRLCIERAPGAGLSFRHGDGTRYGGRPSPVLCDVAAQALAALEALGFKPTRARALVDVVLSADPPKEVAAFVRAALVAS